MRMDNYERLTWAFAVSILVVFVLWRQAVSEKWKARAFDCMGQLKQHEFKFIP